MTSNIHVAPLPPSIARAEVPAEFLTHNTRKAWSSCVPFSSEHARDASRQVQRKLCFPMLEIMFAHLIWAKHTGSNTATTRGNVIPHVQTSTGSEFVRQQSSSNNSKPYTTCSGTNWHAKLVKIRLQVSVQLPLRFKFIIIQTRHTHTHTHTQTQPVLCLPTIADNRRLFHV